MFCYSSASLHSWLWEAALSPNTGNTLCLVNTRFHKKVPGRNQKEQRWLLLNCFKLEWVVWVAVAYSRWGEVFAPQHKKSPIWNNLKNEEEEFEIIWSASPPLLLLISFRDILGHPVLAILTNSAWKPICFLQWMFCKTYLIIHSCSFVK